MEARPGRPKYFVTVAYPYPESPFHLGHARTYTMADIRARYMRMRGRVTLFSLGFHYTGTPILAMARRIQKRDEEAIRLYRDLFHIPEDVIEKFTDPLFIANYFRQDMMLACQEMGYSMDWRRTFTTVDPCYSRLIEWQFGRLRELGLIKQGTYPVGWCPVDKNPMGMHDTRGDVDPEIGEFTAIKFASEGGLLFVTATLRPETVYGVTNLWLNPRARYVRASVNGEAWILAAPAAERLSHQLHVKVEQELSVEDLLSMMAFNPATGRWVPVLPADFVVPDHGTGVVMSVPAHSPDDYVALLEASVREAAHERSVKIEPIPVIRLEGYGEFPARHVVERSGVRSSTDPRLKAITAELYQEEFNRGVMREDTPYPGLSVREARERIRQELRAKGKAAVIYELLNRPVYCRCGAEVVVKLLENQWFIDYGNQAWKEAAREALRSMVILPEAYRTYYEHTIDWLKEKPCARSSGLGTRLPWDRAWVIESLSDSTIYMAYYIIAKYVNAGLLKPENLVDAFFDFVLQGRGKAEEVSKATGLDPELLHQIRQEFEYFYPVDSRHSAHELIPNHLTFYIFNHVALFERRHWPRAIITNGHVLMEGQKMSKSLGNIVPLREAIRTYGADPIRLAVTGFSDLATDAEVSLERLKEYSARLERLKQQVEALCAAPLPALDPNSLQLEDRWLLSKLQERIEAATKAMERMAVKDLVVEALFLMDQDIDWYLEFAKSRGRSLEDRGVRAVLAEVYRSRVKLLAPVIPHLCEELWSRMGGRGFVSVEAWPEPRPELIDEEAVEAMDLIARLMQDLQSLSKRIRIAPKRLVLYTASSAKRQLYLRLLEELEGGRRPDEAIGEALRATRPAIADARAVAEKMVNEILGARPDARRRRMRLAQADEAAWLRYASRFIASRLGLSEAIVQGEEDPARYDPKQRASLALPYRPAIYLE